MLFGFLFHLIESNKIKMSVLRNRKQALKLVQELDAFPKVQDSYQETSAAGGGCECKNTTHKCFSN